MNPSSLPNLSSVNRQLAGDVNRVVNFIDTLPMHVDNLLAAAQAQDWPEVARQSEYLAVTGEECNLQEICEAAKAVQMAISADHRLMARRAVLKLVFRCGSAKLPTQESNANRS
jgi:hypothetical protein